MAWPGTPPPSSPPPGALLCRGPWCGCGRRAYRASGRRPGACGGGRRPRSLPEPPPGDAWGGAGWRLWGGPSVRGPGHLGPPFLCCRRGVRRIRSWNARSGSGAMWGAPLWSSPGWRTDCLWTRRGLRRRRFPATRGGDAQHGGARTSFWARWTRGDAATAPRAAEQGTHALWENRPPPPRGCSVARPAP